MSEEQRCEPHIIKAMITLMDLDNFEKSIAKAELISMKTTLDVISDEMAKKYGQAQLREQRAFAVIRNMPVGNEFMPIHPREES